MPLGKKGFLWTPDEVETVLNQASRAVEESIVPDDLREVAMQYALQLFSQCHVVAGALAVPGRTLQ